MIVAEHLTKSYGITRAVDDLSFTVQPGRVTGFLGPNGAGKTTTMRMILGLDRPTSGRVTIDGRSYRDLPAPLSEVGALIEAKALQGGRTALAHLEVLAASNRIPRSRALEVLRLVGLEQVAHRRLTGFSLGMSQRLGVAGALLGDPGILMFDEPVNGLDPEGIAWVRRLMRDLASAGRTVFVSSHLMSEMALTADRVIVIGRGRLIRDESMSSFIDSSSAQSVLVRSPEAARLAGLVRDEGATVRSDESGALAIVGVDAARVGEIAAAAGIVLHELAPQRASLEEAFMELTSQSVEFHASASADPASALREKGTI
jgi:ABC-2 type transport system ATP-binding protein